MTISFATLAARIFIVFLLLSGSSLAHSASDVPSSQKMGKALYENYCAGCHGMDLNGSDIGPPFLNRIYHPGHHSDLSFFNAAKNGVKAHHWKFGNMKPVKDIEKEHVALIVKFVRYVQKQAGLF